MTTTLNSRITRFRVRVHKWRQYFCKLVYSMPMHERPGIGTMCVDRHARCYYDPAWIETISEDSGAYTLLHESFHLLLRHYDTVVALIGPTPSEALRLRANIAADIVVEQMLRGGGLEQHKPFAVHTYEQHGFPPNLTLAEYFRLLTKEEQDKQEQQRQKPQPQAEQEDDDEGDEEEEFDPDTDDGEQDDELSDEDTAADESNDGGDGDGPEQDDESDADGEPDQGDDGDTEQDGDGEGEGEWQPNPDAIPGTSEGGSCCDGVPREYELPPDETWDGYREDGVLQEMKSRIEKFEKENGIGSVPGCIKDQIEWRLNPQPDPWDQLRSAVTSSTSSCVGAQLYTYTRRSRRQQEGGPILKGKRPTQPSAVVILDTSGSMCCGDDKVRALNVIQQGLARLRSVRVIAGDTRIQKDKRVNRIMDVEWAGCGGTAMDVLIEEVDRKDRPDCIILITDGDTAWPRCRPRARVVVALTRPRKKEFPVWAKGIEVCK